MGEVEPIHSGCMRRLNQCAIVLVQEQAVWQSSRLADIHVVQAIAVNVSKGEPLVALANSKRNVEVAVPMIGAVGQLFLIGRSGTQDRFSAIDEESRLFSCWEDLFVVANFNLL